MSLTTRFFLDTLEIDEPTGWDDLSISIKRDDSLHGIGFEATVNELSFYGEAMRYIDGVKATQGLKAQIVFSAEQNCDGSDEYELVFTGTLNMGKYKKNCGVSCYDTLPIETGSCELTFINRYEQSVDVDKLTSQNGINGLPQYSQLGININLPTKNLDYQVIGTVDPAGDVETVQFTAPGGGSEAYVLVRPEYVPANSDIKDTHLTGGTNVGYSGPHGIFIPISNQVLFNEDNEKCFPEPFHVTGRLSGTVTMSGVSNLDVYAVLLEGELNGSWPINDPNQYIQQITLGTNINTDVTGPFNFDWTITPFDWVPKNNGADGIYLYIALHQHPGANFGGAVFFDDNTTISIVGTKSCPPTEVQSYMVHELLSRVVENVTDVCMRVKSSYYGRTDSEPFAFDDDGCGALRMMTSGLKIRNAEGAKMFISPKDAIEGLQCIDNIGIGVEDDATRPGSMLLRVEELDFFYQDFEIFECLGINEASFEIEEDRDYSIVDIGYQKWTTEFADFGLDEINSDREYHLDIQTLNNTINLRSVLVAGQYPIEITREQQFVESSAANTNYDDDNFIICLRRLAYNTFQVEQGNIDNPQNMFDPPTVYNYRISPLRNLMRWYRSLVNAYPSLGDSANKLYFSAGTGNYIASGELSDGYAYNADFCKLEGIPIRENMDLFVTAFNNVAKYIPLWKNETITYDYPMSLAEYNLIKARRYGYISYQCGNGAISKGWIKNINYTLSQGKATFTLRQKYTV